METREQKPWYHGVKWTLIKRQTEGHAGDTVVIAEESGHGYIARMWNGRTNRDQYAELIAVAPETATQRDSLLSVNKQLLEVLEETDYILSRIVQNGEYKPLNVGAVKELHNRSRAAIRAAKASS